MKKGDKLIKAKENTTKLLAFGILLGILGEPWFWIIVLFGLLFLIIWNAVLASTKKEGEASFPYSFDVVFKAIPEVLEELNWKVENVDKSVGWIQAKMGKFQISVTAGQTISIHVHRRGKKTTVVRASCGRGGGGIFTPIYRRKRIEELFKKLNGYLLRD